MLHIFVQLIEGLSLISQNSTSSPAKTLNQWCRLIKANIQSVFKDLPGKRKHGYLTIITRFGVLQYLQVNFPKLKILLNQETNQELNLHISQVSCRPYVQEHLKRGLQNQTLQLQNPNSSHPAQVGNWLRTIAPQMCGRTTQHNHLLYIWQQSAVFKRGCCVVLQPSSDGFSPPPVIF